MCLGPAPSCARHELYSDHLVLAVGGYATPFSFRTVQYSLDRIYTSRISLNMLTDQHLMVYGHLNTVLDQAGRL
jgi:hypothetical protein